MQNSNENFFTIKQTNYYLVFLHLRCPNSEPHYHNSTEIEDSSVFCYCFSLQILNIKLYYVRFQGMDLNLGIFQISNNIKFGDSRPSVGIQYHLSTSMDSMTSSSFLTNKGNGILRFPFTKDSKYPYYSESMCFANEFAILIYLVYYSYRCIALKCKGYR